MGSASARVPSRIGRISIFNTLTAPDLATVLLARLVHFFLREFAIFDHPEILSKAAEPFCNDIGLHHGGFLSLDPSVVFVDAVHEFLVVRW